MTDEEFEALPNHQNLTELSEWRTKAKLNSFCLAWTERLFGTQHEDERKLIIRMAHSWRTAGLVNTFWKRHDERSHLLVQKILEVDRSVVPPLPVSEPEPFRRPPRNPKAPIQDIKTIENILCDPHTDIPPTDSPATEPPPTKISSTPQK